MAGRFPGAARYPRQSGEKILVKLAMASAPRVGRPFLIHFQTLATQLLAVESADSSARLMAFHFDEAKTATESGKYIAG